MLVAVFTVTHILLLDVVQVQRTWETAGRFCGFTVIRRHQGTKVVGDHAVIGGGMLKRFDRQVETGWVQQ
ncbi:hypothetical protein D3C75_865190 [compost metagenome]